MRRATRAIFPIGERQIIITPDISPLSVGGDTERLLWHVGRILLNRPTSIDAVRYSPPEDVPVRIVIAKPQHPFDSYADGTRNFLLSGDIFTILGLAGEIIQNPELDGCTRHDLTPHLSPDPSRLL